MSNNLVTSGGAALQYQLGTSSDLAVVSGNLTLAGTLNIANAGGFTNTTYTLFTYGGTLLYNGLTIGTVPNANFTYAISTNTIGQVNLIATAPVGASSGQLHGESDQRRGAVERELHRCLVWFSRVLVLDVWGWRNLNEREPVLHVSDSRHVDGIFDRFQCGRSQ